MVICQYYLNNSCHFKNNCKNEHIDLRAQINSEMDAAMKGKQWPLTCFGPFKEKKNLIPGDSDLSFEEIRLQCTEARANNTFHIYEQQLVQKIQEANSRLQSLFNVNKDVLAAVVNLYNEPLDSISAKGGVSPFGSANNTFSSQNTSNAFAIFGASTAPTNPPGNSIFGGSTTGTTQNPQASSIFGASTASPQAATSIFGGSTTITPNPQANSIFGGSTASASPQAASSIFGGGGTFSTQQQPQQSVFGQSTTSNSNIFGSPATTQSNNPFTNSMGTANPFGGTNTFASPVNQSSGTSIFGGQSTFGQSAAPQSSTGIFGQSAQANSIFGKSQSTFGSTATQPETTGFGTFSTQPTHPTSSASASPFALASSAFSQGAVTSTPSTAFANPFGQQPQAQQNPFGGAQSTFGNHAAPPTSSDFPQSTFSQNSTFGTTQSENQNSAMFSAQQGFSVANPAPPAYDQTTPQNSSFVTANTFAQAPSDPPNGSASASTLYTKMENLTPEFLAAFQADEFELGKIPNVPPAKELCFH